MADTSLGRASLSVTADLSNFVQGIEDASAKSRDLGNSFASAANSSNRITTATEKQWAAMNLLQRTKVFNLATQKSNNIETDIATRKLELQAKQMLIDSGAAAKLAKELSALEKAEKKLADAEAKINAAAGRGQGQAGKDMQKAAPKAAGGGMKITDMLGIGFFTAAFTKVFDGAMALVKSIVSGVVDLGAKIIESGSKFQELDRRLSSMTGFKGLATELQDIMKSGPSASFNALGESATRLAALKFRPDAIQGLIKDFNRLGVALGNPEKVVALITDKLADMASEGQATMAALGKLAEEGIPIFEAMASRMGISVDELKRRVAANLITVADAAVGLQDAAAMPNMTAAAQESANSFSGIWSKVTNNIEVLFQNVGVSILKGFGLVSLNTSINNFFESIFTKAKEFSPMLEKFGAVIAMISGKVLDSIEAFLDQWIVTTEKMTVEEMLGEIEVVADRIVKSAIDFITELKPFVEILVAGANQMVKIASGLENMRKNMELDAKAAGDLFKPKHVDNLDNFTIMELMDLQNEVLDNIDQMDEQIQEAVDTRFSGTGGSFMTDLEEAIEASRLSIEKQLAAINDMPLIQEAPRWQKFLDENLGPLKIYQNEIEKLNMLSADGSAQGLKAFAIGSAAAIAKLKQATGLGGPQQFASAVQAGSAAEFQVKVDEMGKAKNVQEEIRQLMEAAAEVEAQQLEAAREIAEAIKNLPAAMPKPQAIAVALNP
jgi:tape measure domain-containing protein